METIKIETDLNRIKNDPNVPVGTIVALNYIIFRKWNGGITKVIKNEGNEITVQEENKEPIVIKKVFEGYKIGDVTINEQRIENSKSTVFSYDKH